MQKFRSTVINSLFACSTLMCPISSSLADSLDSLGTLGADASVVYPLVYGSGGTSKTFLIWPSGRPEGSEPMLVTESGVKPIKDIAPGAKSGFVIADNETIIGKKSSAAIVNGNLLFAGRDASGDVEPWISDGTESGTHKIIDLMPGIQPSFPTAFAGNGKLGYFTGTCGFSNCLWSTDGSDIGTNELLRSNPKNWYETIKIFGVLKNNTLIFAFGGQLWRSDGTKTGTIALTSSSGNSLQSIAYDLTAIPEVGNNLLVRARDSLGNAGFWLVDSASGYSTFIRSFDPQGADNTYSSTSAIVSFKGAFWFVSTENGVRVLYYLSPLGELVKKATFTSDVSGNLEPVFLSSSENFLYIAAALPDRAAANTDRTILFTDGQSSLQVLPGVKNSSVYNVEAFGKLIVTRQGVYDETTKQFSPPQILFGSNTWRSLLWSHIGDDALLLSTDQDGNQIVRRLHDSKVTALPTVLSSGEYRKQITTVIGSTMYHLSSTYEDNQSIVSLSKTERGNPSPVLLNSIILPANNVLLDRVGEQLLVAVVGEKSLLMLSDGKAGAFRNLAELPSPVYATQNAGSCLGLMAKDGIYVTDGRSTNLIDTVPNFRLASTSIDDKVIFMANAGDNLNFYSISCTSKKAVLFAKLPRGSELRITKGTDSATITTSNSGKWSYLLTDGTEKGSTVFTTDSGDSRLFDQSVITSQAGKVYLRSGDCESSKLLEVDINTPKAKVLYKSLSLCSGNNPNSTVLTSGGGRVFGKSLYFLSHEKGSPRIMRAKLDGSGVQSIGNLEGLGEVEFVEMYGPKILLQNKSIGLRTFDVETRLFSTVEGDFDLSTPAKLIEGKLFTATHPVYGESPFLLSIDSKSHGCQRLEPGDCDEENNDGISGTTPTSFASRTPKPSVTTLAKGIQLRLPSSATIKSMQCKLYLKAKSSKYKLAKTIKVTKKPKTFKGIKKGKYKVYCQSAGQPKSQAFYISVKK